VFTRGLDLPRGRDREIVHDSRHREYMLRGSESRSLATVGAFRVVPARDLRDHADRPAHPRDGDLRHLREQGLIETVRIPGYREQAVVLTDRGRDLLEANRDRDRSVSPSTVYTWLTTSLAGRALWPGCQRPDDRGPRRSITRFGATHSPVIGPRHLYRSVRMNENGVAMDRRPTCLYARL
jgi:hypothetical protein